MRVGCVQAGSKPPPFVVRVWQASVIRLGRWQRLRPVRALASSALVASATGCGASGELETDGSFPWAPPAVLDIRSWWEVEDGHVCAAHERGEKCAGETIVNAYVANTPGPGARLVNKGGTGQKQKTMEAVEQSKDWDAAIVNGAADIRRLANCGSLLLPSHIADMGTWDAPSNDFITQRTPEVLRPWVECQGRIYGMVLGLHRLNQVFYNESILQDPNVKAALAASGVDPAQPSGPDDLLSILEAVATNTPFAKPLFIHDDAGTWSRLLVENIMVALANAADSKQPGAASSSTSFWGGLRERNHGSRVNVDTRLLEQALDFAAKLARYITTDSNDPMKAIADGGGAVFTVTGDWVEPRKPTEVKLQPFPGTENSYVYTPDVIVARRQESATLDRQAPILGLAKSSTSAAVQAIFSEKKHSVSPTRELGGVSYAKTTEELFTVDGRTLIGVPGLPAYVPHNTFDRLEAKIGEHMNCLTTESKLSFNDDSTLLCAESRADVVAYVKAQYCAWVSGDIGNCIEGGSSRDPG